MHRTRKLQDKYETQVNEMTVPENTKVENGEQLQLRVINFLYGELSVDELARFEAELDSNPELKQILEDEQRLDSAIPIGVQPLIADDRVQGNRWLLRQNLERENRTGFSVKRWLQSLSDRPFTLAFQGAAMAATFLLGLYVASPSVTQNTVADVSQLATIDRFQLQSPLELINDEDYEIYQLKVNNYDATTGDIDLSFSVASETRLTGNVADQNIHGLMAVALQGDIDSASRLDTIEVLQAVVTGEGPSDKIFDALIYVLNNDQNPGVRFQAVQSLVQLAHEERARDALRYALSEDVNQGVRIQAFQALVNYPDDKTLAVFRQQMEKDSNEFIRSQARLIVEGPNDGVTVDL